MKVPLNSIKKLVDINIPIEELISKVFTQIGAVEDVLDLKKKYEGIIIAEILEKEDHPDSEKLAVYQIDTGQNRKIQVVAGDKTLEVGDKVVYFTPGTKLPNNPNPHKNENIVGKVVLRGVKSEGMMASQKELDIGEDHSKVMRLDKSLIQGSNFSECFGLDDIVLDIENKALANRADCFGWLGIAREIAAMQDIKFESPEWYKYPESNKPQEGNRLELSVDNQTQINCPRYMAIVLDNVEIKPSPIWLQIELAKAGIHCINNIVDITNYLMLLTSQPIHAFDFDKVTETENGHIIVRQAENGEKLLGLNNKVIDLDNSMTVICNEKEPIALAGIIGGKSTEIDINTKRVIIEVANFNRYNIRKTSWKTGIFTEASNRYTKAQDPNQCEPVIYQVVKMAQELANASVASKLHDSYPNKIEPKTINLEIDKANLTSGLNLSKEQVVKLLTNIEYEVNEKGDNQLELIVPTFRQDVSIVEDVYEDIARIYGFNNIKVTLPQRSIQPPKKYEDWDLKQEIRNILSCLGGNELLTYNFVSSNLLSKFNLDVNKAYHIKNALSPDLEFMRINLIPSLVEKLVDNINRGYTKQTLFEINIGHNKDEIDNEKLPLERWTVALVNTNGGKKSDIAHYYNSKLYIDELEKKLNLKTLEYTLLSDTVFDELPIWIKTVSQQYNFNRSAVITYESDSKKYYLGIIGELSNTVIFNLGLPTDISGFELDLSAIHNAKKASSNYQEPSKYPKITQDLCFVMNNDIKYVTIKSEIENILKSSKLYYELSLLDIYSSEKTPNLKQMTFRISLQSRDKTLENWEFDKVKKKVIFLLNEKFKARLI